MTLEEFKEKINRKYLRKGFIILEIPKMFRLDKNAKYEFYARVAKGIDMQVCARSLSALFCKLPNWVKK